MQGGGGDGGDTKSAMDVLGEANVQGDGGEDDDDDAGALMLGPTAGRVSVHSLLFSSKSGDVRTR